MTTALTPLAVSALAVLCERPMHPYEIYRMLMDRHQDETIKVRPGSLYHTIARLAGDELVTAVGTERPGARPERTTYAVTTAGRDALQSWIRSELAAPVNEYPRFPVALGEAHNLTRAEVIERIGARIGVLAAELDVLETQIEVSLTKAAEAHLLTPLFLIDMRNAELGWLRRLVTRLETKELAWPLDG